MIVIEDLFGAEEIVVVDYIIRFDKFKVRSKNMMIQI